MGSLLDIGALVLLGALVNVACTLWVAGLAFHFKSVSIGSFMQTPVFILLFLAPVYVPIGLLSGWLKAGREVNPVTRDRRRRARLHLRRSRRRSARVRLRRSRSARDAVFATRADAARRSAALSRSPQRLAALHDAEADRSSSNRPAPAPAFARVEPPRPQPAGGANRRRRL